MKMIFSPVRTDESLSLSVVGDVLSVNQTEYDFSEVQPDAPLLMKDIKDRWIASDAVREDGMLVLTIILPHGAKPPNETLFPEPIIVENDGVINLPIANLPPPVEVNDD